MKKIAPVLLCLLFVFSIANAQSKFEKATSDPAKLEKQAKLEQLSNYKRDEADLTSTLKGEKTERDMLPITRPWVLHRKR